MTYEAGSPVGQKGDHGHGTLLQGGWLGGGQWPSLLFPVMRISMLGPSKTHSVWAPASFPEQGRHFCMCKKEEETGKHLLGPGDTVSGPQSLSKSHGVGVTCACQGNRIKNKISRHSAENLSEKVEGEENGFTRANSKPPRTCGPGVCRTARSPRCCARRTWPLRACSRDKQ